MNVGWGVRCLAAVGGGSHVCCCEAVVDDVEVLAGAVSLRRGTRESGDSDENVKLIGGE